MVVVSHGLFIRLFLMRFFWWTVEKFHGLCNIDNATMAVLHKDPRTNKYKLQLPKEIERQWRVCLCFAFMFACLIFDRIGLIGAAVQVDTSHQIVLA